jgi:hypothetical protein
MSDYTPSCPFSTQITDSRGVVWQFCYWGSGFVYIRETFDGDDRVIPIGKQASRDDWPFLIDLNDWAQTPETVNRAWLLKHTARWVTDRNADIKAGNIT